MRGLLMWLAVGLLAPLLPAQDEPLVWLQPEEGSKFTWEDQALRVLRGRVSLINAPQVMVLTPRGKFRLEEASGEVSPFGVRIQRGRIYRWVDGVWVEIPPASKGWEWTPTVPLIRNLFSGVGALGTIQIELE